MMKNKSVNVMNDPPLDEVDAFNNIDSKES